jgi:hypothetical protein
MSMNRRDFLQVLLASPLVAKSVAASELSITADTDEPFKIDRKKLSWVSGYDASTDTTWLRVSYQLSNGREWHDLIRHTGNYNSERGLELMWKDHERLINRGVWS